MKIIRSVPALRRQLDRARARKAVIGFVPTMGALHEGHLSLMRAARRQCDIVVVSLFVNPTQFGPNEDFSRYPRDPVGDAAQCRREKIDVLFKPAAGTVYPDGHATRIGVGRLGEIGEGRSRPGHFSGVATVVNVLFQMVQPDVAYFGRKDYQQTAVIRRMVRDLNIPVRIVVRPTVREPDGLAMSSRNRFLSPGQRKAAAVLWKALSAGRGAAAKGERNAAAIRSIVRRVIAREPLVRLDYVAVADPDTMEPVVRIQKRAVLAVAARIGKTRLIDNILITPR